MARLGVCTVLLIVSAVMVMSVSIPGPSLYAQDASAVRTITVEEVKSEEDKGEVSITSEQVEAAREMSDERWYGLLSLWALIILAIVLIRLQVRDDEKLYEEGYYSKEIE
jgi:aromatic ring-opening dioxygenase LigB subunit